MAAILVMECGRKRRRSDSVEAALPRSTAGYADADSPPRACRPICESCASSSLLRKSDVHVDAEYAALVQRSAALLEKMKHRHGVGAVVVSSGVAETSVDENEPATMPCVLDRFQTCAAPPALGAAVQGPHSLLSDLRTLSDTAPLPKREAASQTDSPFSTAAQKERLSSELSAFFTLLHVFFA